MGQLCKNQTLTLMTNIGACCSFCFLFVSVITNYWLYTMEKRLDSNGTTVQLNIYSGLWKKCVQDARTSFSNCSYISYFTHVDKDGIGSTESILLSLRRAVAFPLIGLLLLLIAQTVCFLSHCSLRRQAMTISSGVLYVAGGLFTLVGIIIYIGAITEEAGNKGKSSDDPKFRYSYGPSLLMAIGSFVGSQLTGVMSVHLYISRRDVDYAKTQKLAAIDAGESGGGGGDREGKAPSSKPGAGPPRKDSKAAGRPPQNHPDDEQSWRGYSMADSPSRSDTFCTHTTSKELSSYSLLSRDLPSKGADQESNCRVAFDDDDDRGVVQGRRMGPPAGLAGASSSSARGEGTLSREWSEGSTTTRTDLSRQWSERSVDARSSLSREWSKCSTDELDSLSHRRITPV